MVAARTEGHRSSSLIKILSGTGDEEARIPAKIDTQLA
jgi:hypothetical protein